MYPLSDTPTPTLTLTLNGAERRLTPLQMVEKYRPKIEELGQLQLTGAGSFLPPAMPYLGATSLCTAPCNRDTQHTASTRES